MTQVGVADTNPGIFLQATGTLTTSGAQSSTDTSGPFLIEKQSLNIDYWRVPNGHMDFNSSSVTLSGVSGTSYHVYGTSLVANVNASYSRKKSYDFYSTTSFQQPQKFEILALSADSKGTTYGNTNASTLGPMGAIVSKTDWYKRVPWIAGTHTEVSRKISAKTYFATENPKYSTSTTVDSDGLETKNEAWFINAELAGTFMGDNSKQPGMAAWNYQIPGRYNTAKESLRKVRQFIDDMGQDVTTSGLYANPANTVQQHVAQDQGFSEYDTSRHDYD